MDPNPDTGLLFFDIISQYRAQQPKHYQPGLTPKQKELNEQISHDNPPSKEVKTIVN